MHQLFAESMLRITLGVIFFAHGAGKWETGLDHVSSWFESIGLPGILAYIVAWVELAGGLLMILGVAVRIISWAFSIIMFGALVKVKLAFGLLGNGEVEGYELDLALLAISLYLAVQGKDIFTQYKDFLNKKLSKASTK